MSLNNMAKEYREDAVRIKEWLKSHPESEASSYNEKRSIYVMKEAYRDSKAIARYLELYYDGNRTESGFDREIRITIGRKSND